MSAADRRCLRKRGVDSNQTLSQHRAESVMAFLAANGVRQEFMTAKGWGDAQPVAPNSTAGGRAQNRRVEIAFAD
jgi:outer membrane protein OmpA-like peptidoglycan-associated protein